MAKMRRATNVRYSVGQPISNLSYDPRTLPPLAKHLQRRLLSRGPKAGIRKESITGGFRVLGIYFQILGIGIFLWFVIKNKRNETTGQTRT